MIKSLKEYLEPEDIILEEGSNQSGEYIKCESGKLLMKTAMALVSFGFSPYSFFPGLPSTAASKKNPMIPMIGTITMRIYQPLLRES